MRLKRLERDEGGNAIIVKSDNTRLKEDENGKQVREFPDRSYNEEDLHIIGRVFWHSWELK